MPNHSITMKKNCYLCPLMAFVCLCLLTARLHAAGEELSRYNNDPFVKPIVITPLTLPDSWPTNLHQDHTVGIPSLLLNPLNWIFRLQQEIYGPEGTEDMVKLILAAWKVDIEAAISDGNDPAGGKATGHDILFDERGIVYRDDNVTVEAFRTRHASLQDSFAYRFTSEDRVVVFTGDGGPYHPNIVQAAMNADILITETVTEENIQYAPWGGDTIEAKRKEIFRFHFSPAVLARIAQEAKVKTIVLSHEQNYNSGRDYQPLGLVNEVKAAGFEGEIYSAMDGDVY